jgi:hypothetical protein
MNRVIKTGPAAINELDKIQEDYSGDPLRFCFFSKKISSGARGTVVLHCSLTSREKRHDENTVRTTKNLCISGV